MEIDILASFCSYIISCQIHQCGSQGSLGTFPFTRLLFRVIMDFHGEVLTEVDAPT